MLEHRYGVISREKRHRLQAGKGIKKNGMYIHDRASSFESLPPGPDPKSVAKSIHQYLPRLTKRGTLFRATQATVDQRHEEFCALIEAFFREGVPTLIQELREDSFIRDFFGYWRRDHDLGAKKGLQRPKTAPADAISNGSFISSMFSTSSISLSQSHAAPASPFPPHASRLPSLRRRPKTADSSVASSDVGSTFSVSTLVPPTRSPPPSAPGRMVTSSRDSPTSEDERHTLQRKISPSSSTSSGPLSPSLTSSSSTVSSRRRVNPHRAKSSSPRAETFNVTSDFPLFLSSSTRDLLPSQRPPHSPNYARPGLGTLPEDGEPPPCPRRQKDTSVNVDYNRKCAVWQDTDELSSSDGDVLEHELLTPVDGAVFHMAVGKSISSSSLQSSSALSSSSLQSHRSSWRTSSEHAAPHLADADDSHIEIDFPIITSGDSFHPISPPTSGSSLTLCREDLSRRRRSLSQPMPYIPSVPTDVDGEEGEWSDHGEDIMEAYFGGPDPFFTASVEDPLAYDGVSSECSHDFPYDPPDSPSVVSFPTPRQKVSYIKGAPSAFHHHWERDSLSPPLSPQTPSTATSSFLSAAPADETLVVKAVLDDAIVVFRVERDASFAELRQRVHEKFARSEGMSLHDAFVLAYVPPSAAGGGWKRVSTVSSMSTGSADLARAVPLESEDEWAHAVASCGSKVTIRVGYGTNP